MDTIKAGIIIGLTAFTALCIYLTISLILFSVKTHKSSLKTEQGFVVAKQFRGEVNETGSTVGFTTDGKMTFGTVQIHEKQKFDVVFRCEHKEIFTINDPKIYQKLKENDKVIITYYEILDKNNNVKDLEFVDANLIKTH